MNQQTMNLFNKSCLNKVNISSEEKAMKVIDKYLAKGVVLYYYKCKICGSFHTTKSPPYTYQNHYDKVRA